MRDRVLRKWARIAATHPGWVILALFGVTVVSLISVRTIKVDMRWSDLLPLHDPVVQEFDRILKEYKSVSTIHIVLRGEEQEMKKFAEEVAPLIEKLDDYVERVEYKIDRQFLSEHGFMLVKEKDLERTAEMFQDLNLIPFLTQINDNFETEYIEEEEALSTKEKEDNAVRSLDGLQFWLGAMDTFVSEPDRATRALVESAVDRFLYGEPYFISQDKRVLLISVKPTFSSIEIDKCIASTEAIQEILDKAGSDFPRVKAGITGVIPLQKDEMEHMTVDMKRSSIVALVLVLILFMLTFRVWSTPLLAALNLVIAIIIAAGIVGLVLGRLNLMTSMFAVILIGLGIDYSIHIISVYGERRARDKDTATAMEHALVRAGPGVITGALTTAAAFLALAVSVTRGIREMGIVLGIGIISGMISTLVGIPAMLAAREWVLGKVSRKPVKPPHVEFRVLERFGRIVTRYPLHFLITAAVVTLFFLYQALRVNFDYDMYNLEPEGLTTVELQDTIIDAFDLSPDFALVTASSIEESWEIAERAREMPSFSMVENIGDFCPPQERQAMRRPHVENIRKLLSSNEKEVDLTGVSIERLIEQLERLDMNIYELSQLAFIGGQDKVDEKCMDIVGDPGTEDSRSLVLSLVEKIRGDPEGAAMQLNQFQKYYVPKLRHAVYGMANPELITLDNLPDHIKERYINDAGDTYLVTIYPREQIWDYEVLRRFTKQLARVSPRITGNPPLFLRLIDYIKRDGLLATGLTILVVVLLLWIDFGSVRMALLGMIPLVAGGIWMVGILKSMGMMLNFVNVMGLPMIVGIGIDDGVHLLHRYKLEGFDRTATVLKSTGKAILLTSLTTMAGFGSLMTGSYRGWVSLGALLSIGVGSCFVTTVLFLPAIVNLMERRTGKPLTTSL